MRVLSMELDAWKHKKAYLEFSGVDKYQTVQLNKIAMTFLNLDSISLSPSLYVRLVFPSYETECSMWCVFLGTM